MRVAFEVSMLKHGAALDARRSGLFRVTEGLAAALAAHPRCELVLVAIESYYALLAARAYARARISSAPTITATPRGLPTLAALEDFVVSTDRETRKVEADQGAGGRAPRPRTSRLVKRSLCKIARAVLASGGGQAAEFAAARASECDVFHSPALALPPLFAMNTARFLTCHDVLPIRHPELFEPSHIDFLRAIVASVGPEDHVICVSQTTAADFCDLTDHPRERVHVAHSAAQADLFYPENDLDRRRTIATKYGITTPYVLSVSTLEPRKNLPHILRAFTELVRQQRLEDLTLVLVGGVGWGAKLDEVIADCGDEARFIVRTGYVPDSDLAALYSGALAFVFMSLVEGFGLPPLEAMQCGVPVICSDIGALREVVGAAGILLSPCDVEGLSQAMWQLYQSSSERDVRSRASLQRARDFTWDRTAENVVRAYESATPL